MKVALYTPYLDSFGGGERYMLSIAEYFLERNDQVDIFWNGSPEIIKKYSQLFDLKIQKANLKDNIFNRSTSGVRRFMELVKYDLLFYLSDGSMPFLWSKKNILHFQAPFNLEGQKSFKNKIKLINISSIICNSKFTKKYVDNTYGVTSGVLYPPVDVNKFYAAKKTKSIVSVGRFFSPSHPKKQEVLVDVFKKMCDTGLKEWTLNLVGSASSGDEMVSKLKVLSKNYPVNILSDASFSELQEIYSKSSFYWHAAGFGENLNTNPDRAEHFGISTVESMASGCVPICFAGGGQVEIIEDGVSGFIWETVDELISQTMKVINNKTLLESLSVSAIERSKLFSKENFNNKLSSLL